MYTIPSEILNSLYIDFDNVKALGETIIDKSSWTQLRAMRVRPFIPPDNSFDDVRTAINDFAKIGLETVARIFDLIDDCRAGLVKMGIDPDNMQPVRVSSIRFILDQMFVVYDHLTAIEQEIIKIVEHLRFRIGDQSTAIELMILSKSNE